MTQLQLDTTYGPIYVTPQGDRKLYVQAGRGASIDGARYGSPDPPNLVVRGIPIYVNGHLERDGVGEDWRVQRGFMSVKRAPETGAVTGLGDAPPGATKQVIDALLLAAEDVPEDVLRESQRVVRENEAKDREDDAALLSDLADRLLIEAAALRAGGRVEYPRPSSRQRHQLSGPPRANRRRRATANPPSREDLRAGRARTEAAMRTPFVYIDTRGASRGLYRQAPKGVRLAVHLDAGAVELEVNPDGRWYVHEGPKPGRAGTYKTVARGHLTYTEPGGPLP